MKKILVIGASGQIGSDLVLELRKRFGAENVIASDIREPMKEVFEGGPFVILDALNKKDVETVVDKYKITEVYHLAAILSGNAEKNPAKAWEINMNSLFIILDIAKEKQLSKIFWPSSIAVFGPGTKKQNTPQNDFMDPNTVYGISKLAGERWCEYYFNKYGVDVRSLRYPGLISYKAEAGGGTTDYAVEIFYEAVKNNKYECFLSENTSLPMMYMEDAIDATISLMETEKEKIKIRSSYNLGGISFNPKQLSEEIKKHNHNFTITYKPDFRQAIADSWPQSIDDSVLFEHWGWKQKYNIATMTEEMYKEIKKKLS
jgi:nucleoside-diphosphate-sugar epimerase